MGTCGLLLERELGNLYKSQTVQEKVEHGECILYQLSQFSHSAAVLTQTRNAMLESVKWGER